MVIERTLGIIKPDAIEKGILGELIVRTEEANLKIVGMKMLHLKKEEAEGFYAVHKGKPFFTSLVSFMTSGPCVVMVLEGDNAINGWRATMGVTDPEKAENGSIRKDFGTNIERNAVHGSDAPETAKFEVDYFFNPTDLVSYDWV